MAAPTTTINPNLESILRENRVFPPPPEFSARPTSRASPNTRALYRRSIEDPESFWAEAAQELHWFTPWTRCSSGTCPGPSGL